MNKKRMKRLCFSSLIVGFIFGGITVVPIINVLSFISVLFFSSIIVLKYLKSVRDIESVLTPQLAVIYGSLIGFISFIGFCISFIPLSALIGQFYKNSFYLGINMLFKQGFFILVLLAIFMSLMFGALMNAFSAIVYLWIYNFLNSKENNMVENIEQSDHIDIEIDN